MGSAAWNLLEKTSKYNFLKWGEYMKRAQIAERKLEELEGARREAIDYCYPHLHLMWAASVTAALLDCDFRDAKHEADKYRSDE